MKPKKRSRKIELLVAQGLNDFRVGSHRSLLRGWGGSLDSIRYWQPEDRRIAMPATARTGEITAKVFEEPKLLTIWPVVDISHSMYFGSELARCEAAAVILRILGVSVNHSGDLMGAVLFDDRVQQFYEAQPAGSFLKKVSDFIVERQPAIVPTNLLAALKRLCLEKLTNSLVIIVSDFNFETDEGCLDALQQINSGSNTASLCVVLHDEEELLFTRQRFITDIRDAESDSTLTWNMASKTAVDKLCQSFRQRQDQLKNKLRQVNSEVLFLNISGSYIRDLAKFFAVKNTHSI